MARETSRWRAGKCVVAFKGSRDGAHEMAKAMLFKAKSVKPLHVFLSAVHDKASEFGFRIRHIFDMGNVFRERGVKVDEAFRVYSIMLCSFEGAYKSMQKNPERAAVLLQPKQVLVHETAQGLELHYLPFPREFIKDVLPQDDAFADGLGQACERIRELITACA